MDSKKRKNLFFVGGLSWLFMLVAGTAVYWQYENKAGAAAKAPDDWPSESRIHRATDQATLVILTHPHCPCTRATIYELARLMTQLQGRLAAYVIFIKPDGTEANWEKTDSWASAAEIPGVNVVRDDLGIEAERFDAHTSGQAMLYDKNGKLVFSGGIKVGRGQEGDSAGEAAIVDLVNGNSNTVAETNVFGCPLFANEPYCHVRSGIANVKSKL